MALLLLRASRQLQDTARRVSNTDEILAEVHAVLDETEEAENAIRGYVITGDQKALTPYQEALAAVNQHLRRLQNLTAGNPGQQRRLGRLQPLIASLQQEVESRRLGRFSPDQELRFETAGLALTNQIGDLNAEMENEERRLLKERTASAEASARTTNRVILAGTLVGVGLLLAVAVTIHEASLSARGKRKGCA
ncbi:MAG TPA: CHASE3 domain-containing protein [Terriglobia bacterium]